MSDSLPVIVSPENLSTDPLEAVILIDTAQQMGLIPDVMSEVIDTALAELPFGEQAHGTAQEISPT